MNYTYIVECSDGTFYTGWTNDLDRRIAAHNSGKGAKYTKTRRPVTLVYYEMFEAKEEAMRREYEIKQYSRRQKEKLIDGNAQVFFRKADRKKMMRISSIARRKIPGLWTIVDYPKRDRLAYKIYTYIKIKWQKLPAITKR